MMRKCKMTGFNMVLLSCFLVVLFLPIEESVNFIAFAKEEIASRDGRRVYSSDGKLYAFIRTSDDTVPAGNGDVPADVVCYGTVGSGDPRPLFEKGATMKSGQPIGDIYFGGIEKVEFSNDNKELYWLNSAYAVSGAVIAMNLKTRKVRYVIDANSLEVVRDGRWKGNLIVQRHKYRKEGGSYEARCVVSPGGKEIKQIDGPER